MAIPAIVEGVAYVSSGHRGSGNVALTVYPGGAPVDLSVDLGRPKELTRNLTPAEAVELAAGLLDTARSAVDDPAVMFALLTVNRLVGL